MCACMAVWDHVEVSIKGLESWCHCVLEKPSEAHYTAGLSELLAFIVFMKSAIFAEKAAPALSL